MNLELTFSALQLFVRHIKESNIQKQLPELASLLQAQMQDPNQVANLEAKIKEVRQTLSQFHLYEQQTKVVQNIYDQFGLEDFSSLRFLTTVDDILTKQPGIAVAEINKLNKSLSTAIQQINPFIASLENFKVEEFEIVEPLLTITFPKAFGFEDLEKFNAEINKLLKTIGFFQELTSGSRTHMELISLSSSNPTVFAKLANSVTLLCIIECAQWTLDTTEQALDIALKVQEFRAAGMEAEGKKSEKQIIDKYIEQQVSKKISELATQYPAQNGRAGSEPENLAKQALEGLREHIASGVCIEAQVSFEEEEVTEEETSAGDDGETSINRRIAHRSQSITYKPGKNCATKALSASSSKAKKNSDESNADEDDAEPKDEASSNESKGDS